MSGSTGGSGAGNSNVGRVMFEILSPEVRDDVVAQPQRHVPCDALSTHGQVDQQLVIDALTGSGDVECEIVEGARLGVEYLFDTRKRGAVTGQKINHGLHHVAVQCRRQDAQSGRLAAARVNA